MRVYVKKMMGGREALLWNCVPFVSLCDWHALYEGSLSVFPQDLIIQPGLLLDRKNTSFGSLAFASFSFLPWYVALSTVVSVSKKALRQHGQGCKVGLWNCKHLQQSWGDGKCWFGVGTAPHSPFIGKLCTNQQVGRTLVWLQPFVCWV